MTASSNDEEVNSASLKGAGTDRVPPNVPVVASETNEAGIMLSYPEYWVG
jgi:hypothetical protein